MRLQYHNILVVESVLLVHVSSIIKQKVWRKATCERTTNEKREFA